VTTSCAIATTIPFSEAIAEENLKRQGFVSWLPKFQETIVQRGRKVEKISLLFPGYILIYIEERWRSIMSTRGISRLFVSGDVVGTEDRRRPILMRDEELHRLRMKQDKHGLIQLPSEEFVRGQRVNVVRGVYEGRSAIYQGMSSRDREIVLMSCMGRQVPVELAAGDLG
jgi:transcription antitermination factor NusG